MDGGYAELKGPRDTRGENSGGAFVGGGGAALLRGVTVYRALKKANIVAGQRLAIFGVGGLGHLAVQIGREWVRK